MKWLNSLVSCTETTSHQLIPQGFISEFRYLLK